MLHIIIEIKELSVNLLASPSRLSLPCKRLTPDVERADRSS